MGLINLEVEGVYCTGNRSNSKIRYGMQKKKAAVFSDEIAAAFFSSLEG